MKGKKMKSTSIIAKELLILFLTIAVVSSSAQGAMVNLFDWGLNSGGTLFSPGDSLPANVDDSEFDFITGLGSLSLVISTPGDHHASFFVDHEIDESMNTFFNEFGDVNGIPVSGQSWEIDEPGFGSPAGDIFANFEGSTLENANGIASGSENDVSMALGFDFSITSEERATVSWNISELAPSTGFFLTHSDPDSDSSIFFSGGLDIDGGPVPEPSTYLLFGLGLAGLAVYRKRNNS